MQKIIAAVSISAFTEKKLLSFMDCAALANGKFLLALVDHEPPVPVVTTFEGVGYFAYSQADWKYLNDKEKERTEGFERISDLCQQSSHEWSILHNRVINIDELIHEAKYADLLILDHAVQFSRYTENGYADSLQKILQLAACPVLILRDGAINIEELIFTYNGTASSIYAIKQFTQLFPGLTEKPVSVLYVSENESANAPQLDRIMNYLEFHYGSVGVRILKGNPSHEITSFLRNRKTALVTFGAYGRSKLSRFFHPSEADHTLKALKLPIFVTHV